MKTEMLVQRKTYAKMGGRFKPAKKVAENNPQNDNAPNVPSEFALAQPLVHKQHDAADDNDQELRLSEPVNDNF